MRAKYHKLYLGPLFSILTISHSLLAQFPSDSFVFWVAFVRGQHGDSEMLAASLGQLRKLDADESLLNPTTARTVIISDLPLPSDGNPSQVPSRQLLCRAWRPSSSFRLRSTSFRFCRSISPETGHGDLPLTIRLCIVRSSMFLGDVQIGSGSNKSFHLRRTRRTK